MPGSPLPRLAHPVLTPLPTPSLSGSTIPRPPTGRSHATHTTLTVTMGQLRCGWPIPWDSPRRPVPATLSSLGGEPATPGKADAHPAAGCPVLPGRMQPSACSRASVRWASDPEHLPLWERVPNPAREAQLRTLVLQAGVWAGPRRGWAGRGGAGPTLKRSVFSRSSIAFRDTFPVNLSMEKTPRGSSSTPGPWIL